jgi:hypothetical protein
MIINGIGALVSAINSGFSNEHAVSGPSAPEGCELARAHQIMSLLTLFMSDE